MGRRRPSRSLLVPALLVAGCGSVPAVEVEPLSLDGTAPAVFPDLEPGGAWRIGDAALFHIVAEHGARRTERYVRTVLSGSGSTRMLQFSGTVRPEDGREPISFDEALWTSFQRFDVSVFGGDGEPLATSTSEVPEVLLRRGLFHGAEAYARWTGGEESFDSADPAAVRDLLMSFVAPSALVQLMAENSALRPILWEVVERPSIWGLLRRAGRIDLSIRMEDERVVSTTHALPGASETLRAYRVPFALHVNDELALHLALTVCPTDPPLLVCGGLVEAQGRHPRDPERTVRIELVSSTRGAGEPVPFGPALSVAPVAETPGP